MNTDHENEAQIAAETQHELGCLEWGLEVLLEGGASEHEAMALWITGKADCYCERVRELAS